MRKAIEEYAAECSVCKVVGSENLSYCVDEAVQIYGGYGYHADYPPERAYRDARINRIFEGTNEINRLLITNMLLKRATGGQLPLLSAGQALREEITSGGISAGDAVANLKKIFLLAAGTAFQRFGRELGEQQEVVAAISNIVCEAYTAETALRRTEKLPDNVQAADLAAVHIHDALHRAVGEARTVLHASAEGDTLRTLHSVLVRLSKQEPLDTVAARRRICARLLEWGKYQL
jgi:alkylation response protein AidB-like acyl-CoA dehydrogenase